MQISQQLNKRIIFCRVAVQQRFIAAVIFFAVAAFFGSAWLAAQGKINLGWWLGPCGFKQRYGLPCPTCGMTTATLAFAQGKIWEAFYIQPAAALLCCILVVIALLAFFTAVFGVYFVFLKRFFAEVKVNYLILGLIIIIAAGWAVTLTRALAANIQS